MASQHVLFAETIVAMKKARKRKAYESDSDSEIAHHDNRGQKLKKRARFVHGGQLAPPSGPEMYREVVDHGGYRRAIISRNPPLLDDEGYEVDSDDDEDHVQDVIDSTAEFDPYANIRLENILAPLTSVTDLPTHPTLSRPYKSQTLTELAKQGLNVMHKENAALWKVKHLQTKLIGDQVWAPCEMMIGPNDIALYQDDDTERLRRGKSPVRFDAGMPLLEASQNEVRADGQPSADGNGPAQTVESSDAGTKEADDVDMSMADARPNVHPDNTITETAPRGVEVDDQDSKRNDAENEQEGPTNRIINGRSKDTLAEEENKGASEARDRLKSNHADPPMTNGSIGSARQEEAGAVIPAQQSHEDRDELAADRPPSPVPTMEDDLSIHPLFLPPRSARPDRDLGIPEQEAEDMRRLLQLYIQKQEEVCRGSKRLYEGLLRADRLRKTVLQWSKYEAHRGDMSDGEDWYDKEEWGLDEDLKKGQDEEEEENQQTTKKTRTRR
ncbi:RXT2-like protein [Xylariaceae sp. FL0804]|nr:RXT2-like protein [Xylariaceae sp. FL0804]